MNERDSLETKIDAILETADKVRAQSQEHSRQRMMEIEQRMDQFSKAAATVMSAVIRLRLELLARKFENATLVDPTAGGGHSCICSFGRTDRFPASTTLTLSVGPDDRLEHLVISYRLQILPVFLVFNDHDQLAFPLDAVDENAAITWVEERIGDFVKTYMQLETASQYQQDNMETDPVCGMPVNRNYAAAQMEHLGKTYYFCIEECQRKFAEAPEKFVAAAKQAKGQ